MDGLPKMRCLVLFNLLMLASRIGAVKNYSSKLASGQTLFLGDSVTSSNGKYKLILQAGDGNLVLVHTDNVHYAFWHLGNVVANKGAYRAVMQHDGNFVVYTETGAALWSTATQAYSGAHLTMQDDRNLVVYNAENQAVWSTDTHCRNPGYVSYEKNCNVCCDPSKCDQPLMRAWIRCA